MSQSTKELKEIPIGHYHRVMEQGSAIRRTWHLPRYFTIDSLTTTHLLTPFAAAALGVERATRLGALVPHSRWRMPFGNLLLVRLTRTAEPFRP